MISLKFSKKTLIVLLTIIIADRLSGQTSNSQNYVMTNTVKQTGVTTETSVNGLSIATQGKSQTITYFDGLGRPLQNVVTNGSASQKDLVTPFEYDSYGREVKKYLPYADQTSTTYGSYKDSWTVSQPAFYNGALPNVDADIAPYSVTLLESSPQSKVLAQGASGSTWQPNALNAYDQYSHATQVKYLVNQNLDNVRLFNVDSAGNITTPGYYTVGSLTVKITTDEQQQSVKEFTDKSGHVVVKRVMTAGDSLQTYYLYDNLDMLRGVIQPEGTATLQAAGWVFPSTFKKYWMFIYRYDERGRMVMKKVPGADSVLMLYDQWDRIVLTQDSNLRAGHNFIFTKYDALNRPIITGQINDTRTLDVIRSSVMSSSGRFEKVSTSATEGYTLTGCFPSSTSYMLTNYTITHYDSYINLPSWSSGYAFVNEYGIAAQNTFLVGQVVATQARILGTSNFNRSLNYYDDKYRVTQSTADNAAGGKDRITKILSFDGKVTNDYHSHSSRFFTTALVTQQTYSYDHMDRLLSFTHKTAAQEVVTIAQNSYNELGQLLNKKIHQSPSHPNALQKLDYYYNIRGWLTGINRPLTAETGYEEGDFFDLELHYPTAIMPGAIGQYNGNISEEIYKVGYDEGETGYSYTYDKANRMTSSAWGFAWSNGSSTWTLSKRFDESSLSYDHNGNILALTRYFGDWNVIDNLVYSGYTGNQLGKVVDNAGPNLPVGFQDKTNGTNPDYAYDANGNMISDYNKSITSITYNFLNLPTVVTVTSKGTITYTYDAAGNKLQKTTVDQTVTPNRTTNYYYAGDYVYRSAATGAPDTLEFISHPEGRLRPVRIDTTQAISMANLKYIYDYYLKDHLGSVRSVLTTEQQTDLYAATMETANAAKENALFSNVSSTSSSVPAGFTNNVSNKMASKLNGAVNISPNKRVGPSIILKVMTSDTISISTYGWYTGAVQPAATGVSAISSELIPLLTAGITGLNGSKGGTISSVYTDPFMSSDIASMISKDSTNYISTRPKAFLNWMVVGEDYTAVTSPNHVNAIQMPICNAGDTLKQMVGPTNMVIKRNGWIYIYLSNESAQDVYFDNLVINLKHGPLVEQKDYYPFGMENPALSTKALKFNYYTNNYKYVGKLFDDDFGLSFYEFKFRNYDPQIARFVENDPLASKYVQNSTYAYGENKPVNGIDLEGLEYSPRYIAPNANYELEKRSYEEINKYVPRANSFRNSDRFIPNQTSGSAPKPDDIYEPFEPGTGKQFSGASITKGNTFGKTANAMLNAIGDLKKQIEKLTITTDNFVSNGSFSVTHTVKIEWKNKDAERKFDQLQKQYEMKLQAINDNNKLPSMPGEGATQSDWEEFAKEYNTVISVRDFQQLSLGPSPTEQLYNSATNSNDFKKTESTNYLLPQFSQNPYGY